MSFPANGLIILRINLQTLTPSGDGVSPRPCRLDKTATIGEHVNCSAMLAGLGIGGLPAYGSANKWPTHT
eukprot:10263740-Lingulodinium_polyedra.AAC.1